MSRPELLDALIEFVTEPLGVEADQVVEEANFQDDLHADSLDLVEVIMEIEDRFGLKIDDADSQKMETVSDTLDYLEKHQPPDGYTIKKKDEGGPAGVREPVSPAPLGGAGGTTAEEALNGPA